MSPCQKQPQTRKHKHRSTGHASSSRLAPGRAADHPFCAYLGTHGETCAQTTGLEAVFVLTGPPRMMLLACPAHREQVREMATAFVLHSQTCPQAIAFRYGGQTYQLWVSSAPEKPVC